MTMATKATKTETSMQIKTPGVHHIALRVSDFNRARKFYTETLGFDTILEQDNLLIFLAGKTAIAIRGPEDETPSGDSFNPFHVGLDHLALACDDENELNRVAENLEKANVWNTGIKLDGTLNKKYVAFKDPDRISWEYYMV